MHTSKLATSLALCMLTATASAASHQLVVAANPALLVTNAEVEEITDEMNKTMGTTVYPWDENCNEVRFKRGADVIQSPALKITGTHAELFQNLKEIAPSANVLIVTGLNCSGVQAAGCGPIGSEPMIVGQYPDLNGQLWLHERGHNVGLRHSGEGPLPAESFAPNIGRRFMFWMLGKGHVGKTAEECKAFKTTKLSSVLQEPVAPAVPMVGLGAAVTAPMTLLAMNSVAAQAFPSAEQPSTSYEAELAQEAAQANLTPQAFRIIGAPWVDGAPVDAIKNLSQQDLDSIRGVLKGSPNRYWSQGISVLGIAGSANDVELIKAALDLPMPAVGPIADRETVRAVRNLTGIKLSAPLALGVLANRTKSSQAVEILKETASLDRSTMLIGRETGDSLSKNALTALAVAGTSASKSFLDTVINLQNAGQLPQPITKDNLGAARAAPLSVPETVILDKNAQEVQLRGIDSYINRSSHR